MVKAITIYLDDEDLEKLKRKKEEAGMTWRELILQLIEKDEGGKRGKEEGSSG